MKKLATMTAAAALLLGSAGAAQAGGGSVSDSEEFFCYLNFFKTITVQIDNVDTDVMVYAQGMIDDSVEAIVISKRDEIVTKYTTDEGYTLGDWLGNLASEEEFCNGALVNGDLVSPYSP